MVEITSSNHRYDILELCKQVVEADETATSKEFELLESLARTFKIDADRWRKIRDSIPVSIIEGDNVQNILGLTPNMPVEEQLNQLNSEFRKWKSRVNHSDRKIREQAQKRVKLIQEERNRLKQYEDANR